MNSNPGFQTLEVPLQVIEDLRFNGEIQLQNTEITLYPNLYLELKATENTKETILARVTADGWIKILSNLNKTSISPKNREQAFALDALLNDEITVVILTGPAGTGKTILTLAVALDKTTNRKYKRTIITRPMSQVGKYQLGALPGDADEKFGPYLQNYTTNLEQLVGHKRISSEHINMMRLEMMPLQLFRGASFNNCMVIADEMQVCGHQEILTIGTRIGENSKLVIMGDLDQRDDNIAANKTGIYKLLHSKYIRESPLVASIELIKSERSPTARLFAKVFK